MGLLRNIFVVLVIVLQQSLVADGAWFKPQAEESESTGEAEIWLCPRMENLYKRRCIRNPGRRFCRRLGSVLTLGQCTPPCVTSNSCEDPDQQCQTECAEANAIPGLCGRNKQCCLTNSGLDDCPTSDAGVTCESAATCTGSGVTVDSGFACTGEGEVCCRREIQPCPESEVGMLCEASATCTGSGATANTSFSCTTAGQVCCQRECPTTDTGVSCESAATCTGSGSTQDTGSSCPLDGQVCCRRSCPVNPGSVKCEARCSVGFFELQGFPCPNPGELCCEIGLGRR